MGVILTESRRIRLTGVKVPCAVWDGSRDPSVIEIPTCHFRSFISLSVILTIGVGVLLTGEQIFPSTIRLSNVFLRVNQIAAGNATVEPDYHPQVCQVVHGG